MSYSHEDNDKNNVYNDPIVDKDRNFPWRSVVKDVDDQHPLRETEEGEQESYGLEQEAWLALQDNPPGGKQNFLTFWNSETDYYTIRHVQG
jgi:hypothetical protein